MKSADQILAEHEASRIFLLLQGSLALSGMPHSIMNLGGAGEPLFVRVSVHGNATDLHTYAEAVAWLNELSRTTANPLLVREPPYRPRVAPAEFPWCPVPLILFVFFALLFALSRLQ